MASQFRFVGETSGEHKYVRLEADGERVFSMHYSPTNPRTPDEIATFLNELVTPLNFVLRELARQ